jgi:hypothetical protein
MGWPHRQLWEFLGARKIAVTIQLAGASEQRRMLRVVLRSAYEYHGLRSGRRKCRHEPLRCHFSRLSFLYKTSGRVSDFLIAVRWEMCIGDKLIGGCAASAGCPGLMSRVGGCSCEWSPSSETVANFLCVPRIIPTVDGTPVVRPFLISPAVDSFAVKLQMS